MHVVCFIMSYVGPQPVALWLVRNQRYFKSIFPEAIIDKSYKCCNRKVRPLRLIGNKMVMPVIHAPLFLFHDGVGRLLSCSI